MKNKLILHIGTMKTGTTAIQKFLSDNKYLLSKYGYSYPTIQKIRFKYINGSALHNYIKNSTGGGTPDFNCDGWKDFWKKTREELKKNNVILSWELMFDYDIKEFFSAVKKEYDNIQIILYLRRQDIYVESKWNQSIKAYFAFTETFKYYIDYLTPRYLYSLDILSDIFGKNNVTVRVYEKEQFKGKRKDAVSDFMYSLGIDIDWDKVSLPKSNNVSMFGNMIEIKRKFNNYLGNRNYQHPNIEYIFLGYLAEIYDNNSIHHAQGMFTPEDRAKFLKQFDKENEEIARKYLGREDGILFYDNRPIKMHSLDLNSFCEDVKNLFEFFVNKWNNSLLAVNDLCDNYTDNNIIMLKETANKKQIQIQKMLEYINEGNFDEKTFIDKCLDVVEEYAPFVIDIYDEYYKRFEYIKNYILDKLNGRNLVFFGTGEHCDDIIRDFDFIPDFFLDNNKTKQGLEAYGRNIFHPSEIKDWKDCFISIVIKNADIVKSVEEQLNSYGLEKEKDYIILSNVLG